MLVFSEKLSLEIKETYRAPYDMRDLHKMVINNIG
jgi:hypothetical protein